MKNALKFRPVSEQHGASLRFATVLESKDGLYYLSGATIATPALRADGCALIPRKGDRVLYITDGSGETYILTVLNRHDKQNAEMAVEGALTISADSINIAGVEKLSMGAKEVEMEGERGSIFFGLFSFLAGYAESKVKDGSFVAEKWDSAIGRLTQKVKDSFRTIFRLEETKAERIRMVVADRFSVKSKTASIKAEGDVTIDGDKINLG